MVQLSESGLIKAIFFVHFIAITWTISANWLISAYSFYNTLFLVSLFWCLSDKASSDAMFMATSLNIIAFVFDIICMAYAPYSSLSVSWFSKT